MLKILLVRHAQCEMNLTISENIGGRTNHSPLTSLGEQQARALGAHLRAAFQHAGTPPSSIQFYSSTAVRAVDTAKALMDALEVSSSELVQSEQLLELDQGEWEGRVRRECYTPELTAQFAADPWGVGWTFEAPGGESQKQVEERMVAYLTQHILPRLTPDAPAVVVSHGMALKTVVRHLLSSIPTMSRNIAMGNTSVQAVGFVPSTPGSSSGTWHLLSVNDVAHLPYGLRS